MTVTRRLNRPTYIDERKDLMGSKGSNSNNNTGAFDGINQEVMAALKEITDNGNDAEVRRRQDGTIDVFELQKRKRKRAS